MCGRAPLSVNAVGGGFTLPRVAVKPRVTEPAWKPPDHWFVTR